MLQFYQSHKASTIFCTSKIIQLPENFVSVFFLLSNYGYKGTVLTADFSEAGGDGCKKISSGFSVLHNFLLLPMTTKYTVQNIKMYN